MNWTLKEILTKLIMETGGDWVALHPFVLYRVRNSPYTHVLTAFEILLSRPLPILPNVQSDLLSSGMLS